MDNAETTHNDSLVRRRRYSASQKLEIIDVARNTSYSTACERFGVSRSSISSWCKQEVSLRATRAASKRQDDHNVVAGSNSPNDLEVSRQSTVTAATESCDDGMNSTDDKVSTIPGISAPARHDVAMDGLLCAESVLIGYVGEEGGFPQLVAQRVVDGLQHNRPAPDVEFRVTGYPQIVYVLDALDKREVDYALIGSEVLFSPTFRAPLDRLMTLRYKLIGSIKTEDTVCVCALPGVELKDVDCVMSDWHVLRWFEDSIINLETENGQLIHRQIAWDSATACRLVREEHDTKTVVLCSKEAAIAYGLDVLNHSCLTGIMRGDYFVVSRHGDTHLPLQYIGASIKPNARLATVLVCSVGRLKLVEVIEAFGRLGIAIEHLDLHDNHHDPSRYGQTCVITYQSSTLIIEAALSHHLAASSDKVVHLGAYLAFIMRE